MGPWRQHLRRMDRRRFVHREDPKRLIALGALHAFDDQPRTFVRGLITVAPKHGDVQKHVWRSVVWNDEAVALRCIEPFDDTADFDKVSRGLTEARKRIDGRVALDTGRKFARTKPARSRRA